MINWNKCKPIPDQEIGEIIEQAQQGDQKAIDRLVKGNLKLVAKIAHRYRSFGGLPVEDLVSAGTIGLLEAIPLFDPRKGVKFITYAQSWIKARILNTVIENFSLVNINTSEANRKIFWRLSRESRELKRLGVEVTSKALATRIGVHEAHVDRMQTRLSMPEKSLDATDPVTGKSVADRLASDQNPESYAVKKITTAWLHDRMIEFEQRLDPIFFQVWQRRIVKEDPDTHDQIAKDLEVSKQYTSQLESKLLKSFIKYARNRA